MTLRGRYVAVVGPADGARPSDLGAAEEIGRGLAAAGAVVLTGGHHGVMRAAARGARDAGGTSIGLLPGTDRTEGRSSTRSCSRPGWASCATGCSSGPPTPWWRSVAAGAR